MAPHHRHNPGRYHRAGARTHVPDPVRQPLAAAVFLTINGLILLTGEWLRRKAPVEADDVAAEREPVSVGGHTTDGVARTVDGGDQRRARQLTTLRYPEAAVIGFFQTFALLAGISRSGISMVGGLARGLSHRAAARFSFLLATPVMLAARVLKLPSLAGPAGAQTHGQVLLGAVIAGIASTSRSSG